MSFLTRDPIDVAALTKGAVGNSDGGIATFVGLVRDHQDGHTVARLEYSAYEPMADAECAAIVHAAEARWPVRIEVRHRLGALEIGDIAVAVVAASAHRAPAFEACRYVIEEVKRRVPVWKKEFYADGSIGWVDPAAHAVRAESTRRPDPAQAPA